MCSLGHHFTDIKGSKYMLVHSLASEYARFVVLGRLMYWTPPSDHWTPPFKRGPFFREPRDIGPPPFKNPGHGLVTLYTDFSRLCLLQVSVFNYLIMTP